MNDAKEHTHKWGAYSRNSKIHYSDEVSAVRGSGYQQNALKCTIGGTSRATFGINNK